LVKYAHHLGCGGSWIFVCSCNSLFGKNWWFVQAVVTDYVCRRQQVRFVFVPTNHNLGIEGVLKFTEKLFEVQALVPKFNLLIRKISVPYQYRENQAAVQAVDG